MEASELSQRIEDVYGDWFEEELDIARYTLLLLAHHREEVEQADDEELGELLKRIRGHLTVLFDQKEAANAEINEFMKTHAPGPSPELTSCLLRLIKTQRDLLNFSIGIKKEH